MIIGMLAFLLAAVLILLLIPIRYTVTLVRWRLTLSVSVLLGLWRKEIELPPARKEPSPQKSLQRTGWKKRSHRQKRRQKCMRGCRMLPRGKQRVRVRRRKGPPFGERSVSPWEMGSRSVSSMRQEISCRTAFHAGAAFGETLGQAIP